ncbi:DUF5610 domain-containing protein [Thalassolituus oleivorans]|uniref:DUF5610 domain-containing protein n=1 Tax=Thalassolituus oleivorans TaxID=187493 RepID=UPI0024091746|nr:DUF5610 domain-containing protein [Thalassolituus oleivorans]MDF1639993.1 DUF5610 domain-containing protein [Thalassolituus oleivorans]
MSIQFNNSLNSYHSLTSGHKYSGHSTDGAARKSTTETSTDSTEATQATAKAAPTVVQGPKQSAQDTAANILAHVTAGIESLRDQGAGEERIQQRIDAARSGISKGYADAEDMLDSMGLLDDEMKAQITASRKLVDDGLDALANPDQSAPADVAATTEPDSVLTNQAVTSERSVRGSSNTLSMQVVTRDGDKVTVNFKHQQGQFSVSNGSNSLSGSTFSQNFELEVEGSLDQGELDALSALFDDVKSLSDKFFGGDLGAALGEAMNLGFDGNELASMSLDLRQRSFSSVSRAYAAGAPSLPTPKLDSLQSPLAQYVDEYIKALDKASPLAEPRTTLQDMMQQWLPEKPDYHILQSFNEGLNRLL